MKRKRKNKKGAVSEEEAVEFLMELYDAGHNMADCIVEKLLGPEMSRDEREEIVQAGFLKLADKVEALKGMTPAAQMRTLGECMWKTAFVVSEQRKEDSMKPPVKEEESEEKEKDQDEGKQDEDPAHET